MSSTTKDLNNAEQGVSVNPMLIARGEAATPATTTTTTTTTTNTRSLLRYAVVVLAITNIVAIAVATTYAVKYHNDQSSSSPAPRASTVALFSANHPNTEPSARVVSSNRTTTHMERAHVSYKGTARENKTIAAGVTRVNHPDSGEDVFDVHTEIYVDGHFGEYAGSNGAVGDRSLRIRIVDLKSGAEVILVPHSLSLSMAGNVTLIPNHYFFSYISSPGATPVSTYMSTLVSGRVVLYNDVGAAEYAAIMPRFLQAYEAAWSADHPSASNSTTRRRRLGFGSWAGGKVGGWLGGRIGGDAGSEIGASFGSGVGSGESIGQAGGAAVGGYIGHDVGEAVGEDAGGAIGGALGTAIGGPIGGVIGEEAGSWLGGKVGGDVGEDVGEDVGGRMGQGLENDIENWF